MSRLSLRSNLSWLVFGNVSYAAAMWAVLWILAKTGPEVVGAFALSQAIVLPVIFLTNQDLRVVIATDSASEQAFGVYAAQRVVFTVLALLIIAAIMAFTGYSTDIVLIVFLIAMYRGTDAFTDILYGLSLQRERMDNIAISMVLRGPVMLPVFAGLMWKTNNLSVALLWQLCCWAVVLVFYDIPKGKKLVGGMDGLIPRWDRAAMFQLTRRTAPLGLAVAVGSAYQTVPRYFIEHFCGLAPLGIFATLAYFALVGQVLVNATGHGVVPRMATLWEQGEWRKYWQLVGWMVGFNAALAVSGVLVAVFLGAPILRVMYGPEYAAHSTLLVPIMFAGGLNYLAWFAKNILNSMRLFGRQAPLAICALTSMLIACAMLVPQHGLEGAAWAWTIAAAIHLVLASALIGFSARGHHVHA